MSSTSTVVEPTAQPPRITEVSLAAVMRLAGRLRDLDGVMGLWDDLERECKGTSFSERCLASVPFSIVQWANTINADSTDCFGRYGTLLFG